MNDHRSYLRLEQLRKQSLNKISVFNGIRIHELGDTRLVLEHCNGHGLRFLLRLNILSGLFLLNCVHDCVGHSLIHSCEFHIFHFPSEKAWQYVHSYGQYSIGILQMYIPLHPFCIKVSTPISPVSSSSSSSSSLLLLLLFLISCFPVVDYFSNFLQCFKNLWQGIERFAIAKVPNIFNNISFPLRNLYQFLSNYRIII